MSLVKCKLPDCPVSFKPKRATHVYCSKYCYSHYLWLKRSSPHSKQPPKCDNPQGHTSPLYLVAGSKTNQLRRVRRGVKERDALITQWLRLPQWVIDHKLLFYSPLNDNPTFLKYLRYDAISVGMVALIRAAELYDPTTKLRFSTYATASIFNAIVRDFFENGGMIHVPGYLNAKGVKQAILDAGFKAKQVGSLDWNLIGSDPNSSSQDSYVKTISCSNTREPSALLEFGEDWAKCSIMLELLPPRQSYIIKQHFLHGLNLTEISKHLNCSKERVRQLYVAAITELRTLMGVDLAEIPAKIGA